MHDEWVQLLREVCQFTGQLPGKAADELFISLWEVNHKDALRFALAIYKDSKGAWEPPFHLLEGACAYGEVE